MQPSSASEQGPLYSPSALIHHSNEESEPDRDEGSLQASTVQIDNPIAELPVLLHVNPRWGSTSGGEEIYLIVKNLPSTAVLYARFGSNIAPTVSSLDGSEPADRKECTDNTPLVSHCEWCTCLPSPSRNSPWGRRRHSVSSSLCSREKLWEVSSFLRIRHQHL